jgi:hypothetical protein
MGRSAGACRRKMSPPGLPPCDGDHNFRTIQNDSESLRSSRQLANDLAGPRGRLSGRETGRTGLHLPVVMIPASGSRGRKPHVRREAPRVHIAARRRGGGVAAGGARAAGRRAGAAHRHALETLETLENYPEVTGTSGRASTWSHLFHSSPARRKPSINSCRSLSRVNRTDSAIHLRETSG